MCVSVCVCVSMCVHDLVWNSVRREQKGLEESRIFKNKQPGKKKVPSLSAPSLPLHFSIFASTHL